MDQQRKTIQELTSALDGKLTQLSAVYRDFGELILSDALDPVAPAGIVSDDVLNQYKTLMAARETATASVLAIKESVQRQQELLGFRKALEQTLSGEAVTYSTLLSALGTALFSSLESEGNETLSKAFDQVRSSQKQLAELEKTAASIDASLRNGNLFTKLHGAVKLNGLKNTIKIQQEQIEALMGDAADRLVTSGELKTAVDAGFTGVEVADLFQQVTAARNQIGEGRRRGDDVAKELQRLREVLAREGALDNPGRRLDELRQHIHDTDRRIESVSSHAARDYADRFLSDDGQKLADSTSGSPWSDRLDMVASTRSDISRTRKKIESLETAISIETIARAIAAMELSIAENRRKIEALQVANTDLERRIAQSRDEKQELTAHKEKLDNLLSSS